MYVGVYAFGSMVVYLVNEYVVLMLYVVMWVW